MNFAPHVNSVKVNLESPCPIVEVKSNWTSKKVEKRVEEAVEKRQEEEAVEKVREDHEANDGGE